MFGAIKSFLGGIDPRLVTGAVVGLLLWFVGYLGGRKTNAKKEHKVDVADTKAQVKQDRIEKGKSDEEIIDDFASRFSGR